MTTFRLGPEVRSSIWLVPKIVKILLAGTYGFASRVIPRKVLDLLLALPLRIASPDQQPLAVNPRPDSDHPEPLNSSTHGMELEKDISSERDARLGESWVNLVDGL